MKKIFILFTSFTINFAANTQTQIGNSGFENWENLGTGNGTEPINWNSFKSASGSFNNFGAVQIEQSLDARPGSNGESSCRIFSRSQSIGFFSINVNGLVTLGRINMGATDPNHANNYNGTIRADDKFSEALTDAPDSIVFWVKYIPGNNNSNWLARMKATIHGDHDYKDPEDASSTSHVVARADLDFPHTNNQWVRKSVPFNYIGNSSDVKYILITFATNNTPGGGTGNDQVWIDDIELIYNPITINHTTNACAVNFSFDATSLGGSTSRPWTNYTWSFPGGTPNSSTTQNPSVTYNTAGTHSVTLTVSNNFGSRTVTKNITVGPNTTFNYPLNTVCIGGSNVTPTVIESGGVFSATPNGLSVNASTGEIDINTSTAGVYSVQYKISGSCSDSSIQTFTITSSPDATFNYSGSSFCKTHTNVLPTFAQNASAGVFSSSTGLDINASTGEINFANSIANTYTIYNTIPANGTCAETKDSVTITIHDCANLDDILEEKIYIYPNPFNESISIENNIDNTEYQITNIAGKIVQTGKLSLGKNIIHTAEFEKGMYFINIQQNNQNLIYKVTK